MNDIQYHWRFYKPRPTRDLIREVWDNWPAHFQRPNVLTFVDLDDEDHESGNASPLRSNNKRQRSLLTFLRPSSREPTPSPLPSCHPTPLSREGPPLSPNDLEGYTANERVEEDAETHIVGVVQNPLKVKTKGRPLGALNKRTASQANLNSNCRDRSRFEYVEAEEQAAEVGSHTTSTRERPRGRGRGQGG